MTGRWVAEALPVGASFRVDVCATCGQQDLEMSSYGFLQPVTRSADPDPDTGLYDLLTHHQWCPVIRGGDPDGCPLCGTSIVSYQWAPGYSLAVEDPVFGTAHLVGTAEEVFASARPGAGSLVVTREKSLDEIQVRPCRHTLRGERAGRVLTIVQDAARQRRDTAAAALFEQEKPLLDAATAAGHRAVVDAYRQAVRADTRDAAGLRAALLLLCPGVGA